MDHVHSFDVDGMHCGSCVARVEVSVNVVSGVSNANANLATKRVTVTGGTINAVIEALSAAGYPAKLSIFEQPKPATDEPLNQLRRDTFLAALLAAPVVVLAMGGHLVPVFARMLNDVLGEPLNWIIQFVLTSLVLFGPGWRFFKAGLPALRGGAPDMNSLVAIGSGAAWSFSTLVTFFPAVIPQDARTVYFEAACVIITLILLGRLVEGRAKGRTGKAIEKLVGMQPQSAMRIVDGIARTVVVSELIVGDVIQLRPGERVAVDGEISEGRSFIDESMMTGEPVPVAKTVGSQVFAGTVNGQGALTYSATQVGAGTVLAQIIKMVSEAQGAKLPVQDLINRIALWFVPTVLVIAALTFIVWYAFGPSVGHALVACVSVLIIACPCAMGLATPMSIMVGMGRAAELGVLFRKGEALQSLGRATGVAFDKTGTLTLGRPVLGDIQVVDHAELNDVLVYAAAVEHYSEHPLATVITGAAAERGLTIPTAKDVVADAGLGIRGAVADRLVVVGGTRYMESLKIDLTTFSEPKEGTLIFVAIDGKAAGLFTVTDRPRDEASAVIAALHALGLRTALITGDNARAAAVIGAQTGITKITADVLPDGKIAALSALGAHTVFVGDGINDAPVLAAAHVGIAVGTGTDIAIESADVVLMSGHLGGVVNAFAISRATMRNIRQNLIWAFGYNVLLIPVAAGVLYPVTGLLLSPMLAAGAMGLSSVFVVTNALRLQWMKPILS